MEGSRGEPGQCWAPGSRSLHLSPQSSQENPSHRQLAGLHLEKYSFPVEMMICLPNGTVVGTRGLGAVGRGHVWHHLSCEASCWS